MSSHSLTSADLTILATIMKIKLPTTLLVMVIAVSVHPFYDASLTFRTPSQIYTTKTVLGIQRLWPSLYPSSSTFLLGQHRGQHSGLTTNVMRFISNFPCNYWTNGTVTINYNYKDSTGTNTSTHKINTLPRFFKLKTGKFHLKSYEIPWNQ